MRIPVPGPRNGSKIGRTDLLMLVTVLLWAINLSVIKIGLRDLSPHAFNAVRLTIAALAYLPLLAFAPRASAMKKGDGWKAAGLGLLGVSAYQLFFIQAIGHMNASTASVIMATSPVFIALFSTALGQERVHWAGWLGIAFSFAGLILVLSGMNGGLALTWDGSRGAVLILLANLCWAAYTVLSRPVLSRNSALRTAAVGTTLGTLAYLPFTLGEVRAIDWGRITWEGWGAVFYSGLVAIVLCFVLWYDSVQKVGSAKTGIYVNLTPVFAGFFAVLVLGERLTGPQVAGAGLTMAGVYLTRSGYRLFERRPRGGV